jgi:hypothetical protein
MWKKLTILLVCAGLFPARGEGPVSEETAYSGMCDASAGVALGDGLFAVANDEDNAIRVYRSDKGGPPVASFELSRFLKVDPLKPETDLEGACWLGDRIFWISSFGRNAEGKYRMSRQYLFATKWVATNGVFQMVPVGVPYQNLLMDLLVDPRLSKFRLNAASLQAPKSKGGLNIEGLCQTPDGRLLIGFRNPIPKGGALVVPLLNANEVVEGKGAKLGEPILLDLDGLGIRDMALWTHQGRDRYLILAGSYDSEGTTRLYEWNGTDNPKRIKEVKLKKFNPEAIVVDPERAKHFQLLSDDGTKLIDGECCKVLADPQKKQFRSVWVDLSKEAK